MDTIITIEDYNNLVNNNKDKLIILRFFAEWCQPCKLLEKNINSIKLNYSNVIFTNIDADSVDNSDLLDKFDVRTLPKLVFIKNGVVLEETVGLLTIETLSNKINENQNK